LKDMPTPTIVRSEDDRRRHPRRRSQHPLVLEMLVDEELFPCDTLDVSVGGMRVRSMEPLRLGMCDIVVFADTDDPLILMGEVREILVSTPEFTTARIVFLPLLPDAAAAGHDLDTSGIALAASLRQDFADHRSHRRGLLLLAASVAAALVAVAGARIATSPDDAMPEPTAAVSTPPQVEPAAPSTGMRPDSTGSPRTTVTTTAPTATPVAAPAPVTTAPAPVPVVAAPVTRTEGSDNAVRIILGTTSEDTAVMSSVGPSEGVDRVKVQLNVTPEPNGTSLPLEVTFENRGDEAITFTDGFTATITSMRDGVVTGTATFTASDVTEVAPGQTVRAPGFFDFGSTGEHDITVDIAITE
jgi:hypothetical protein